jgi:hypothetical protein
MINAIYFLQKKVISYEIRIIYKYVNDKRRLVFHKLHMYEWQ